MKIWERHGFLEVTVGYFPEELAAYEIATTMVRIVVFLFPVLAFLEFLLYWTYQQWVILFEPLYGSVILNFCFVSISFILGVKFYRRTSILNIYRSPSHVALPPVITLL